MKFILTSIANEPFTMRRISPNWGLLKALGSEEAVIQQVIKRNKEVGLVPCESEVERSQVLAEFAAKHENHPDVAPLVLPPIGPHWVIDEADLPGGVVNSANDYFFEAWEWDDGVVINMTKALSLIHISEPTRPY